jgi:hypothetical protein
VRIETAVAWWCLTLVGCVLAWVALVTQESPSTLAVVAGSICLLGFLGFWLTAVAKAGKAEQ